MRERRQLATCCALKEPFALGGNDRISLEKTPEADVSKDFLYVPEARSCSRAVSQQNCHHG